MVSFNGSPNWTTIIIFVIFVTRPPKTNRIIKNLISFQKIADFMIYHVYLFSGPQNEVNWVFWCHRDEANNNSMFYSDHLFSFVVLHYLAPWSSLMKGQGQIIEIAMTMFEPVWMPFLIALWDCRCQNNDKSGCGFLFMFNNVLI